MLEENAPKGIIGQMTGMQMSICYDWIQVLEIGVEILVVES
jgi:hypothetical protein